MNNFSNEISLLIELSRLDFNNGDNKILKLFEKIDFNKFIKIANKHKMILVIERNIKSLNENKCLDNTFVAQVNYLAKVLRYKLEIINFELEQLLEIFKDNNIKVVLMKGASLNRIYQQGNLRYFNDIDLLIHVEDVEKVHFLLTSQQYVFIQKPDIEENVLKNAAKQVYSCIGNYEKKNNGMSIKIDLHKADDQNAWNLLDFYDCTCNDEKGYYHFNVIDTFIFACFHAWHHYPRVVSIKLKTYLASLKDYMDIRESYLFIKNQGLLDELYLRINTLGCNAIINNMLYLAERLYTPFCIRNNIITCEQIIENDCNKSGLSSRFERRLFLPDIEHIFLNRYYQEKLRTPSDTEFIACNYFNKEILENYNNEKFWCLNQKYHSVKNIYYDEPYGTAINRYEGYKFSFSLAWDYTSLIINMRVIGKYSFGGQESYFNPTQDCIKFIFRDDWTEVFVLQLKNSGNHILFMDKGDVFKLCKIHDNITYCYEEDGGYNVITNIPWKYTSILPKYGEILPFYFNIVIRNKELYHTDTMVYNDEKNRLIKMM